MALRDHTKGKGIGNQSKPGDKIKRILRELPDEYREELLELLNDAAVGHLTIANAMQAEFPDKPEWRISQSAVRQWRFANRPEVWPS